MAPMLLNYLQEEVELKYIKVMFFSKLIQCSLVLIFFLDVTYYFNMDILDSYVKDQYVRIKIYQDYQLDSFQHQPETIINLFAYIQLELNISKLFFQNPIKLIVNIKLQLNMKDDEASKKRKRISEQLKQKIKRKPYMEEIGGKQYTYSLLKKKNQKFVFSNERLLILKGLTSIGYARNIPDKVYLPFYEQQSIPPYKQQILLSNVQNVTAQADLLTVQFAPQINQLKWQFVCESKNVAAQWKKTISDAVNAMKLNASNNPIQVNLSEELNQQQTNSNFNPQISQNIGQPNTVQNISQNFNNSQGVNPNVNSDLGSNLSNNSSQQPINSNYAEYSPSSNPQMNQSGTQRSGLSSNGINLAIIPEQHQDNQTQNQNRTSGPPLGIAHQAIHKTNSILLSSNGGVKTQQKLVDFKQEYLRLKKQEQKMKSQWVDKGDVLKSSAISNKKQQKILDCNWDYEFAKGQNEYIIVQKFKQFVQGLAIKIIDQLSLQQKRRQYKPISQNLLQLYYQVGGVSITIPLLQLNEVSSFQDRSTIISSVSIKQIQQQFKNANYILQLTRNRGRFRVPLMMIVQYKGFTILAKSTIHSTNDYSNLNSLQQDINQLERDTKISRDLFEDQENLKVVAADQKFFEKLSRSQNKFKKFDICYLTDIRHFIPQDFYGIGREGSQFHKLRPQFLQDEQYQELLFHGGNLSGVLSRVKVSTETRDAINLLTQISRSILQRITTLVLSLQSLDQSLTNSAQLSNLLHLSGINIRYLGSVLDHSKESWLRGILTAQIIARSAKYFLRYDLQDSATNLGVNNIEQAKQYQINQVLGWLNRIVGIGPESDSLWRQIFRQAQTYFKCTINRQNINFGFLIQALQKHGGIRLRGVTLQQPYFKANNIFTRNNFVQFSANFKLYDLSFTDHYSLVEARLQELTFESFQQLNSILNLQKREGFDSHYKLGDVYEKIILFLINWLSPQQAPFLYNVSSDPLPSQLFYEIQLTAIKWELKSNRIAEAQKIRDYVVDHINRWLGVCHPFLSQLYDIFARYYLGFRDEQKRAVSYCKSALKNQQKLLGGQHIKLADGYYHLAGIYLHYAKKLDALTSYKRAAQILTQNQSTDSQAFLQICLKVGQLYLANNAIDQALNSAKQSLYLAQQLNNPVLFLSSVELMGRCFQVGDKWNEYSKFVRQVYSSTAPFKQNQQQLQRMIKVILLPTLHNIAIKSRQSCKNLLAILYEFQQKSATLAYSYIKSKVQQKVFPLNILEYLQNIQNILKQIQSSGLMIRWKGFQVNMARMGQTKSNRSFQFLCMLEALHWFLSGNFIEGVFAQQQ